MLSASVNTAIANNPSPPATILFIFIVAFLIWNKLSGHIKKAPCTYALSPYRNLVILDFDLMLNFTSTLQ